LNVESVFGAMAVRFNSSSPLKNVKWSEKFGIEIAAEELQLTLFGASLNMTLNAQQLNLVQNSTIVAHFGQKVDKLLESGKHYTN
jgi:hypothetical protein